MISTLPYAAVFAAKPNRQPIRRHSYLKGREGLFWQSITRQDARRIVLAARKYDLDTKQHGQRNGALGTVAIEVLDYVANLIDYRTGRLEPSLQHLMEKLKRSKDAIVRALKALRDHGFIDWIRRYVPADDDTGRVQVKQTSNAYRLNLPERARKLLGRYGQQSPMPDDEAQRIAERERLIEEHRASLSLAELPLFDVEDEGLAEVLSRLGQMVQERESAKRSESLSNDFLLGQVSHIPIKLT